MLAYAVAPTPMAADAYEAAHEKWAHSLPTCARRRRTR